MINSSYYMLVFCVEIILCFFRFFRYYMIYFMSPDFDEMSAVTGSIHANITDCIQVLKVNNN